MFLGGVSVTSIGKKNTSFPQLLQKVGYKTAIAGKWQINDFRIEPEALKKHGFDDWCVWTGYESGNKPSAERYWDPYIHTQSGSKTYQGKFGPDLYCDFLVEFIQKNRDQPHMILLSNGADSRPTRSHPR